MRSRVVSVRSIEDRIRLISEKIEEGKRDPFVHQLKSEILARRAGDRWAVPEKDWAGEVAALFDFFRNNVRYTRDTEGLDTFQRARRTFQLGTGDCDDAVISLGALLKSAGYPIRATVVGVDSAEPNHIYLRVGLPPRNPTHWPALDASVDREPGWEITEESGARVLYRKDFNL